MLHLDPRIAFDEHVVPALVEQEFDRAGAGVVDLAGERHGVLADPGAQFLRQVGRRGELDHLLVAALHTAVPLEQMHHVAVGVGQDLHLDVAGVEHRLLEIDHRVAEGRFGFPAGGLHRFGQRGAIGHPAHTAPAAA